jgi:uncharacterized repeat protein (TIGR03803 family)
MTTFYCYARLSLGLFTAALAALSGQVSFRVISDLHQYGGFASGLVEGSPGVFYTMQPYYPAATSVTIHGRVTALATFQSGLGILSGLVSAPNRRFYSAIEYSINPAQVFSVDSSARSGETYAPQSLAPHLVGNLPEGTLFGWAADNANGSTYLAKSDPAGNVAPISQFPAGDIPIYPIYATDGNYYVLDYNNNGTNNFIYKVTPSGNASKLYTLPTGSIGSIGVVTPLLQASDGNLYGVTPYGGANGKEGGGTLYKLTLSGQYTLLYSFTDHANTHPQTLLQASDGNFYGATLGSGGPSLLFRYTTSGQYSIVYPMKNMNQDGQCPCFLTQGADGIIYGTSALWGPTGTGTFFALDAGLPKPAPQAVKFGPQKGPAGTRVRIWGYNLLSASVQFNGAAATSVSNSGPNYVWATVPAGATTGPITVTTPGGTSTTSATFMVE